MGDSASGIAKGITPKSASKMPIAALANRYSRVMFICATGSRHRRLGGTRLFAFWRSSFILCNSSWAALPAPTIVMY